MIPSQYITIAKWVAIVGLLGTVYYTIRNHGHTLAENESLHDKIKIETEARKQAEAQANDLSKKLQEFQQIDIDREREIGQARERTYRAMRELENLRGDTAFGLCLDYPIPGSLAERVREASSGLRLPDSP